METKAERPKDKKNNKNVPKHKIQELLRDLFLQIALCPHRGCLCLAKSLAFLRLAFEFSEKIRSQMATRASLQAS